MFAIRLSWPGLSTMLTTLVSSDFFPQLAHFDSVEYPSGSEHLGHL